MTTVPSIRSELALVELDVDTNHGGLMPVESKINATTNTGKTIQLSNLIWV